MQFQQEFAEEFVGRHGVTGAFKGYMGYPSSLCASINEVVVHGIPSDRTLKEGDIIGLDLGAVVGGFYGDAALTLPVGEVVMLQPAVAGKTAILTL